MPMNKVMTHLETELKSLKDDTMDMGGLVISQLNKSFDALETFDKDLCRDVIATEKRVNSMELKIDRDCEQIFALYNPVAIDLRFVLATLKINTNLERIGDIAEGISKFILSEDKAYDPELLKVTHLEGMFKESILIVQQVMDAFFNEDTKLARSIFQKDEHLDDINKKANGLLSEYIPSNLNNLEQALNTLSIIRKLERVGDQSKNIAEEIIFYVEAKVLKHAKPNKKKTNGE